jgi:FtsP/CotA-like multicopper oxidase with cupredoxin domain
VDVLACFRGDRGRFMLHGHNLEHEDMAMMADLDVIQLTPGGTPR